MARDNRRNRQRGQRRPPIPLGTSFTCDVVEFYDNQAEVIISVKFARGVYEQAGVAVVRSDIVGIDNRPYNPPLVSNSDGTISFPAEVTINTTFVARITYLDERGNARMASKPLRVEKPKPKLANKLVVIIPSVDENGVQEPTAPNGGFIVNLRTLHGEDGVNDTVNATSKDDFSFSVDNNPPTGNAPGHKIEVPEIRTIVVYTSRDWQKINFGTEFMVPQTFEFRKRR